MGDNNKSGYELRSDLLGMAIRIVDQRINRMFENEHLKPEGQRTAVSPFTTEDVIAEAEKLYAFVQKKQIFFLYCEKSTDISLDLWYRKIIYTFLRIQEKTVLSQKY